MSNILRLAAATKLAEGRTALEVIARNADEDNLWPIVKDLLNKQWHTNFATVEEVEELSSRFKVYLDGLSFYQIQRRPVITTVISACLLRMARALLSTPAEISIDDIPIMNGLANNHILDYDEYRKQPVDFIDFMEFDFDKVFKELDLSYISQDLIREVKDKIISGEHGGLFKFTPARFEVSLKQLQDCTVISGRDWRYLASYYYQLVKYLFEFETDDQMKEKLNSVKSYFSSPVSKKDIYTFASDMILLWDTTQPLNTFEEFRSYLLYDLKVMLGIIHTFE